MSFQVVKITFQAGKAPIERVVCCRDKRPMAQAKADALNRGQDFKTEDKVIVSYVVREVPTARLDANKTAKPLSSLINHPILPEDGLTYSPAYLPKRNLEYVNHETGNRIPIE